MTSAINYVCQVPQNKGGGTGSFTCTDTATATLASNVRYTGKAGGETVWHTDGSLNLQVAEANYDSLSWYSKNKANIVAFVPNSTQRNCKSITALGESTIPVRRDDLPPGSVAVQENFNICKSGSNFQLIELDPALGSSARELSFNLRFQTDSDGDTLCQFLEDVVEFIEAAVNVEKDTEAALSGELEVDQMLLEAWEGLLST